MAAVLAAIKVVVERNGELTALEFVGSLGKVVRKIWENPQDPKFRRLKARSKIVERTFLGAQGGLEVLIALGFRRKKVMVKKKAKAMAVTTRTIADALRESSADALVSMGFKRSYAIKALIAADSDMEIACASLVEKGADARGEDVEKVQEAAEEEEEEEEVFVMEEALADPSGVLKLVEEEVPLLIEARRTSLKEAAKAKSAVEKRRKGQEREAAKLRWREDEMDRADRRARKTPVTTPIYSRSDETSVLIDEQNAAFVASAEADRMDTEEQPPPKRASAHETVCISVRTPGAPAVRRDFLSSWRLEDLARHLGRGRPVQIVAPDSTGRRIKLDQAAETTIAFLEGATIDVTEEVPSPTEAPLADDVMEEEVVALVDEEERYRRALTRLATVAPVESFGDEEEQEEAVMWPGLSSLIRELREVQKELAPRLSTWSAWLRFKTRDPRSMRILLVCPQVSAYSECLIEVALRIPDDYPASPPRLTMLTPSMSQDLLTGVGQAGLANKSIMGTLRDLVEERLSGSTASLSTTLRSWTSALQRCNGRYCFREMVRAHLAQRAPVITQRARAMEDPALEEFEQLFASDVEEQRTIRLRVMPDSFACSITHDCMCDPVIADDGHTYERGAVERWLQTRRTSPKTGERLPTTRLVPNHTLRAMIADWRTAQNLPPLPPWLPPPREAPQPRRHRGPAPRHHHHNEEEEDEEEDYGGDGEEMPEYFPGEGLRMSDVGEAERQAEAAAAVEALEVQQRGEAAARAEQRAQVQRHRQAFINGLTNQQP